MPYISVEIDWDDIDTDELLNELKSRITRKVDKKQLKDDEAKTIMEVAGIIKGSAVIVPTQNGKTSLIDSMKIEWFNENIGRITLEQLESLIK